MQRPRKRAIASCSQCYLRKQKCDRQYPCCHCIRRRRPEICSYAVQHSSSSDGVRNASKSTQENRVLGDAHNIADDYRGLKRVRQETVDQGDEDNDNDNSKSPRNPDLHGRGQNETGQDTSESSELGLMAAGTGDDDNISLALGYSNHGTENLAGLMKYFELLHCEDANDQLSKSAFRHVREPYSRLMKQFFPRREVADLLVQIFFRDVNWMYESIHSATFLDQYHDWWTNFPGTAIEDMSFAILLLRICSYTTQFLPSPNYTAATVGGERLSTLSEKCHGLATKLTNLHKSSGAQPTRIDVLQYFFATCYTKNEGRVKDAWDHLGEAIHIAMNLGMHEETRESSDPLLGGFEIDMRRRTFWNLYIWDRFMSVILDRWPRLPEERCTVAYPYMQMQPSSDSSSGEVPDSYIERLVQAKLARCCSSHYRPSCGKPARYDMHLIEQQHVFLTKELAELPSVFAIDNPDTQWDKFVPNMVKRRQMLYIAVQAILSTHHRPVLRFPRSKIQSLSPKERQITYHHRVRFVKHTLALLEDLSRLHTLIGGYQTRLFILAFYTFEAAMGLGMHLISLATVQDLYIFQLAPEDLIGEGPWKRETCMREMLTALQRLQVLSEVSVIARIGAREVSQLVLRIKPLFSDSQPIRGMIPTASERLRDYGRTNMQSVSNASSGPSSNASLLSETDAVGFGGMQGTGSFTSPNSAAQTFPTPNNELVYESNGFDFAFPYTANTDWPMPLLPLNYSWQPQQDEIDLELLFSASTSSTQLCSRYP